MKGVTSGRCVTLVPLKDGQENQFAKGVPKLASLPGTTRERPSHRSLIVRDRQEENRHVTRCSVERGVRVGSPGVTEQTWKELLFQKGATKPKRRSLPVFLAACLISHPHHPPFPSSLPSHPGKFGVKTKSDESCRMSSRFRDRFRSVRPWIYRFMHSHTVPETH